MAEPSVGADAAAAPQPTGEEVARMFTEAMQLRRSDPVAAVALFKAVLAARVAQHGEMALQCASAYMQYGMALFEQAQFSADILGDTVRQAADERAEQVVAEELADDAAEEGKPDDAAAGPSTSAPAAAAAGGDSPSKQQQQEAEDAEDAAAESEDADDADEDGEEQQEEEEGEADDMQLAWENLEVARIIYEKEGSLDTHASEIAEIHNFTGDIFCEQEKFEEAIQEYRKCAAVLAAAPGGEDARRTAEVYFKLSLALQYNDQASEALEAVQTAQTKLQAHLEGLVSKLALARGAPASTTPTADAAFAALAAAVASYTPPKAPAAGGGDAQQQQQEEEEAAQLEEEVGDIKAVLADLEDKVEELQAIVKEDISMKDTLRQAFKAFAAAEEGGEGGSSGGAGPVQDLGVVGKGKRIAPTPAAAAAGGSSGATEAAVPSKPKRSLEDLMGGPVPGGATSIGFGASKANVAAAAAGGGAAAADGGTAAEVAVKKVKTSGAAGAAEGAENQQQAQ